MKMDNNNQIISWMKENKTKTFKLIWLDPDWKDLAAVIFVPQELDSCVFYAKHPNHTKYWRRFGQKLHNDFVFTSEQIIELLEP